MAKGHPTDVLAQAAAVLAACKQIDPNISAGTISLPIFADDMAQLQATLSQLQVLELQQTDLRIKRDQQSDHIWDTVKRTRSSVKGTYGDDSSEYELVGGTRISERKHTARRKLA